MGNLMNIELLKRCLALFALAIALISSQTSEQTAGKTQIHILFYDEEIIFAPKM